MIKKTVPIFLLQLLILSLWSQIEAKAQSDSTKYSIVEQMPEYPGGNEQLSAFLAKNIHYPDRAKEKNVSGVVYVNFVVERSGEVSNVRVLRGIGGGCDEEAVRVVGMMDKWTPGMQRGETVRVSYNLPINFTLDNSKKKKKKKKE